MYTGSGTGAFGFATNSMRSAESRLARLLDEAAAAHDAVERLIIRRPQPQPLLGQSQEQSTLPRAAPPSTLVKVDELALSVDQQLAAASVVPAGLSTAAQVPLSTRSLNNEPDDFATQPGNAKAVRSSRMVSRLTRELSEARAQWRALDVENVSLRAALERARDDVEAANSLRRELDEARARLREMEQRVNEEANRADRERENAREAEAERERLRTLLAGTVWYEYEKKSVAQS